MSSLGVVSSKNMYNYIFEITELYEEYLEVHNKDSFKKEELYSKIYAKLLMLDDKMRGIVINNLKIDLKEFPGLVDETSKKR